MKTLIILVTSIVAGFGLLAGVSERLRPSERKGSENSRSAKLDRAYIADMLKKQGLSVENKIIVGNVWATWCKPCVSEMTELSELYEKYRREDILFVALTTEETFHVKGFIKRNNLSFEYDLLFSQADLISYIFKTKKGNSVPVNFILDKDGTELFYETGYSRSFIGQMDRILAGL